MNSYDFLQLFQGLIHVFYGTKFCVTDIKNSCNKNKQTDSNGIVKSGGLREFIPLMAKLALASNVNGLFMEVHTDPDNSKCDAPTQWDIKDLNREINY